MRSSWTSMSLGFFLTLAGASSAMAQWGDVCGFNDWAFAGPVWYDTSYGPVGDSWYEPASYGPVRYEPNYGGPVGGWCEPRIVRAAPRYDAPPARRAQSPCPPNPPVRQAQRPADRCGCGPDQIRLLTVRQGSVALVPSPEGPPRARVLLEWCGTFYDGQAVRFASDCDFEYYRLEPHHGPGPQSPAPHHGPDDGSQDPGGRPPEGGFIPPSPATKVAIRTSGSDRETSLWIKRPCDRGYTKIGNASVRCIQRPMPGPGPQPGPHGQPGGPRTEPVPRDPDRYDDEPIAPGREAAPADDRFRPRDERFQRQREEGPRNPRPDRPNDDFRRERPADPVDPATPARDVPPDQGRERLPNDPSTPSDAGARPAPGEGDSRFIRVKPRNRPDANDGRDSAPPDDRPRVAPMNPPEPPPGGTDRPASDSRDSQQGASPKLPVSGQVVVRRVSGVTADPVASEGAADAEIPASGEAAAEAEIPLPAKSNAVPVSRDSVRTWSLPSDPTRIRVRGGLGNGVAYRSGEPSRRAVSGALAMVAR
jgi:hypothetical protein